MNTIDPIRISYQTIEFGVLDIHLRTLRDRQEFSDSYGEAEKLGISSATWSYFGVVWPSSRVLAQSVFESDYAGKRILEVGCGIALTSLMLNQLHADITATDYHPQAEHFLLANVALNSGRPIPFSRSGWGDGPTDLGQFDLIVGSDLLYEDEHAELLSGFINQHAKATVEIIMVDPGRSRHAQFSKKMVSLGYQHSQTKPDTSTWLTAPFSGVVLRYSR